MFKRKMQYLVKCDDGSFCVIYKKSIMVNEHKSTIDIGDIITFNWPENSKKPKKYTGTLIDKNSK